VLSGVASGKGNREIARELKLVSMAVKIRA
jgi:DNA-binding NarL/FixJ family response regulator